MQVVTEYSIDMLTEFMRRCHEKQYDRFWKYVEKRLIGFSIRASKFLAYTKPYELLEELTGLRSPFENIVAYPIDVYREGGSIHAANPNRVITSSGYRTLPTLYLSVVHEAGHLLVHRWNVKLVNRVIDFCKRIDLRLSIYIINVLKELSTALLQELANEKSLGIRELRIAT